MQLTNQQKAYIALCATSTIWGTTWVAMKVGVQYMPAFQMAAIRQLLGGTLLTSFFILKKQPIPSWKQLKQLFIFSLFTFVFANALATFSLQYITSGLASLISALYPLSVVVIEFLFYQKKNISKLAFIGILVGLSGIVFIFYENAFASLPPKYWLGVFLSFIAMVSWSYSTILIGNNKIGLSNYVSMGWQMLLSSIPIYFISLFFGKNVNLVNIPSEAWISIVYLIFAGSIISLVAFIYSMRHLPASIASLYAYINPIVATFVGSFLLKETVSITIIIGTLITLAGVYMVKTYTKK
ncbi:MAG: DMT family transporter [Chitinophagaceae bacterium]